MKILIACEFSGTVRDAFIRKGHTAISCDILPTEAPGPHYTGDIRNILYSDAWDLVIAFPPCTYLCSMGVWWNHKRPERWLETDKAQEFFMLFADLPCRYAIENPVGIMSTRYRKPDQVIQPWQFGHEANKPTCLWLQGIPKLTPTQIVSRGKFYTKKNGARMSAWSHKCSGTNKAKRARIASITFPGIADAMAEQWSNAIYQPSMI